MKILVTGGAGFIGSNVVDAYVEAGHECIVVDDLSSGKAENINPAARFHRVDIRSPELLEIMDSEKPELVNHHAAQISVPASVEDPLHDADINIKGLLNILEGIKNSRACKLIFISSGGAIYGEATEYPTGEGYSPQPLSPYAISKAVGENYLAFYSRHYGIDYTVLRYANVYGPRQIPHGEAGVVSIFTERLLAALACNLYHFPDEPRGMIRDYCFVGDIVRANLLALSSGSREAYNIGTGVGTHTAELYDLIFKAVKERLPLPDDSLSVPLSMEARGGDLTRSCLRVDKAAGGLGWEPNVGLEDGIKKTLEWTIAKL